MAKKKVTIKKHWRKTKKGKVQVKEHKRKVNRGAREIILGDIRDRYRPKRTIILRQVGDDIEDIDIREVFNKETLAQRKRGYSPRRNRLKKKRFGSGGGLGDMMGEARRRDDLKKKIEKKSIELDKLKDGDNPEKQQQIVDEIRQLKKRMYQ